MTRSTLKTFWLTGGGLLATWFAVNPNTTRPVASDVADAARAGVAREVTLEDLTLQQSRLRAHIGNAPSRPSARNPFRFGKAMAAEVPHPSAPSAAVAAAPAPPPRPSMTLSGIATDGRTRTAIISGDGEVYLAKEGDGVAGRYRVVTVESDAVTLRDEAGVETRLVLH
jgi:hypothetical protein